MKTATPKPDGGKYVIRYRYSVKIMKRTSYSGKIIEVKLVFS